MSDVWFKGPIAEAVSTVTQKNLLLLVFIYDDSEHSQKLEAILNDENLVSVIKQKTIALKMSNDSEHATMFGQLYPISQVPIVYFILQGTIKDFGIQDLTSQDIIDKINTLSPNAISSSSSSNNAKEKLSELRKKRVEEEKAQAKEREIKRREEGKLAQETQQTLQEKQNKLYIEKMRQEKKADEEYKKKVKEQIAIDRANQIATRKAEKQKREENKPKQDIPSRSSSFYDHCNLNIKQLDGSSLRHSFSPSNTLATVSQWIDASRTDGDMPFKLFAQFPNRNFDIGDEQRTLLELKLCPSGTLIMKPIKNATSAYAGSSNSSSGGWLNYLYSAGDTVYNSVSSVSTAVTSFLVTPTTPEPGQRLGGTNQPSSSNSNINTLDAPKYKKDDDRQTYNGNSVNQE